MTLAPFLSVVVPTCGRGSQLAELLDRLRPERQHVPGSDYEVIVTDDAPVPADVDARQARYPAIQFITGPGRGPAANRNHGARFARGEWIVFTDDDCQPVDGWLAAVRAATAQPLDVIEGRILSPYKREGILYRYVENPVGGCFWSANLAFRRDVFARLGGFDEDFPEAGGEDMELAFRIQHAQLAASFVPEALVYHPPHMTTWRGWLRYQFAIRWHVLYMLKTRQGVPLEASTPKALVGLVTTRSVNLARVTWHALRGRSGASPRTALLSAGLGWLMYPVMLPYVAYWDVRFRRMLRARQQAAAGGSR